MNNAKSIISGTTLTGYENMANISQAANAAFNVLSSEKTNGDTTTSRNNTSPHIPVSTAICNSSL